MNNWKKKILRQIKENKNNNNLNILIELTNNDIMNIEKITNELIFYNRNGKLHYSKNCN